MRAAPAATAPQSASELPAHLLRWVDRLLPWLTLLIMGFYLVQWFFVYPYIGFRFASTSGEIDLEYLVDDDTLQVGDVLQRLNGVSIEAFRADYRSEPFRGLRTGDVVPLIIIRGEETLLLDWVIPGPTAREIEGRLSNQWWLALAFWLAGVVVWLSVRPRDRRRTLLMSFNFVTALWLVVSPIANWHIAGSMFLFKAAMWFSLPVTLQLHWEFPSRLARVRRGLWPLLYALAGLLSVLELLQWVPQNLHYLSFASAAVGSGIIIAWRAWRRPAERAFVAPLALALALGMLVPLLGVLALALIDGLPPYIAGGTLMTLAALPGAYVYAILLQQLGDRSPRLKRLLPLYLVLVAAGTLLIAFVALLSGVLRQTPTSIAEQLQPLVVILAIVLVSFVPLVSLAALASALQTPLAPDQLGFRASRLFAPLLFGILLLVTVIGFASLLESFIPFVGSWLLVSVAAAGLTVLLVRQLYQPFVRLVDDRLLGIPRIASATQQHFAARISARLSRSGLTEVLVAELLPSLFIRQSVLVLLPQRVHPGQRQTIFYSDGLQDNQLPQEADSAWLRALPGEPARAELSWVRQAINLRIGADLVGVWLLGKREPDDYYSEPELEGLQHIADQLAIAVVHITQSELLRDLYSANIERQELADRQLAGELHDEVLSRLAALRMLADDGAASPQFDAAFEALTARIRDTISGLRPALLTYGLAAALAELVEDLSLRSGRHPIVRLTVSGEPQRLPKRIEEHLFRIVQQAAENSLAHAQANEINIRATFAPDQVLLEVADDGVGLPFDVLDQLPQLVHNRHFGLAGMIERATLIGAPLSFLPAPTGGVLVRLTLALSPAGPPAGQ